MKHTKGGSVESSPEYLQVEVPRLDEGCEDGISFSRRSVLTEKLIPARWTPVARRGRARRVRTESEPVETLPV